MSKPNGYAKRDERIEALRTVADDSALALEALVERGMPHHVSRVVIEGIIQRLRDAVKANRSGP